MVIFEKSGISLTVVKRSEACQKRRLQHCDTFEILPQVVRNTSYKGQANTLPAFQDQQNLFDLT